jgi:hypothetical protein
MPRKKDSSNQTQKRTPGNKPGGFLFDLKLPPLAVIIVSLLMTCLLSQVTAASTVSHSGYVGDTQIAPLFTSEVQYWGEEINTWSQEHNLDPNLVATVMQIESCGNPRAKSSVGAMGLFQVMPYHFAASENPYKANTNALRGLSFLKMALEAREGNVKFGLAGYNAGITGAKRSEFLWPSETIRYVYWGMGIYSDAQQGKVTSERLNEWLSAGGASLCRKAAEQLGIP